MEKKIACERKHVIDEFKVSIGTMDRKNPWIFYIELSTFVRKDPRFCDNSYQVITNRIKKCFKTITFNGIDIDNKRTIVDVDFTNTNSKLGTNPCLSIKSFYVQKRTSDITDFKTLYQKLLNTTNNEIVSIVTNNIKSAGLIASKLKK